MMLLGVMMQIDHGRIWLAAAFGVLFVVAIVMAGRTWKNRGSAEVPPPGTD